MSENLFSPGHGRVAPRHVTAIDRIAQRHGAQFTTMPIPDSDLQRYWFSAPAYGSPFDDQTARNVINDLKAEGLWPVTRRR